MKRARRLLWWTLALLVGLTAWAVARGAVLLNVDGKQIVIMSSDEFVKAMQEKDAQIEALKAAIDAKRKVECNLI